MADKEYHQEYWQKYKKQKPRVRIPVSSAQYLKYKKEADKSGRTVGQQILLQAESKSESGFVPTVEIEKGLKEVSLLIRSVSNGVNQLVRYSHEFQRIVEQEEVFRRLKELEKIVLDYVRGSGAGSNREQDDSSLHEVQNRDDN